ncbi:unnamed protein product [Didymodactylos carnosus]|uniref:Metal-dependent hydrolase n=1 Tax=Didymodactylos carnosus TaxID=1234261 RepID=A0A814ZG82_9BILA|nr:unnamed protein product [Didymodactylos carnosus]CAF1255515.1 unnamed protein product [Didymodactylos carnosus]CAF4005320.1 unnamed protein product [Didymodactylos carnosus]CAF4062568.1 unnamed protein product [Didymodactylos carnosus]
MEVSRDALLTDSAVNDRNSTKDIMADEHVPKPRDYHFHLDPKNARNWHTAGIHVSIFFHAMSLFFPEGEKMFMHAVRLHKKQIPDSNVLLKNQVTGFICQEMYHSREHRVYNESITKIWKIIPKLEAIVAWICTNISKYVPRRTQLAITVALEHWTAILAQIIIGDQRVFANTEPNFHLLWKWHALEETEHKAVAFDVWTTVYGTGFLAYVHRCLILILATTVFWTLVWGFFIAIIIEDGSWKNLVEYGKLLSFQWISPGVFRQVTPIYLDWFIKYHFHPWDHNNRDKLGEMAALSKIINQIS